MRNKFLLLCALGVINAAPAQEPAVRSEKRLTQEEFLKQIEALTPPGDLPKRAAAATPAPVVTAPVAKVQTKSKSPSPAPPPVPEMPPDKKERKGKGATEITAEEETTFDQKTHQAVFLGQVVVKDPEFNVACDKLTAFLRHEEETKPGSGSNPKPAPEGAAKKGGLDRAIAEGSVIITQDKVEADGSMKRSIGRASRADYLAASGEITLTGKPQLQQGINTCLSTAVDTVMVLTREGKLHVKGPHLWTIQDKMDEK